MLSGYRKKNCRLCNEEDLDLVLMLEDSALANDFTNSPLSDGEGKFPLDLYKCNNCGHFQLIDIVYPEIMFKNYLYCSGTSSLMRSHFKNYANDIIKLLNLNEDSLVCDIGSNDSTLLKEFNKNKVKVIGVEPAANLAALSNKNNIPTICDFFNEKCVYKIEDQFEKADVITSNNCFAHLDDLKQFTLCVKKLLKNDGVFIFENAYLLDMLKTNDFSQIYHEHLSYHSIKPLNIFFENLGMKICKVDFIDIHGGSIRVFVTKKESNILEVNDVQNLIENEEKTGIYNDVKNCEYKSFFNDLPIMRKNLKEKLLKIKSEGKTIAGVLASAKSTTFLHYCGIGNDILDFIADDAPEKIGKYSPGKHIPILPFSAIYDKKPDYLLMMSYNFIDFIKNKHSEFKGKWINPFELNNVK